MSISRDDPGVQWLLASAEPAVRCLTLTDVLGERPDNPDVVAARTAFADGPIARALLAPGHEHVYAKWQGAFWRLTALVELGVPPDHPTAHDQLRTVLSWLHRMERTGYPPVIAGRPRAHAVWHGHALAAAVALDWPDQRETAWLVERLLQWQWPDGGWNCDRDAHPACSSVHESLGPVWGLAAYHRLSGDPHASQAVHRAAEFFLERRLFRSRQTGAVIHPSWLRFRHPAYYHYNVLQALWVLGTAGLAADPRVDDAVDLVASRRRRDGAWDANGRWWNQVGRPGPNVEVADWGPSRPNYLITLKALTVLASRGNAARDEPERSEAGVAGLDTREASSGDDGRQILHAVGHAVVHDQRQ